MNKFFLAILFVVSTSFALNVVGEEPSFSFFGEPVPGYFRLDNKGGEEIKGVKVYYYLDIDYIYELYFFFHLFHIFFHLLT